MTAFDQAVRAQSDGAQIAQLLAAQLPMVSFTDDERLNLLDGDIYYWQGRLDIVRHGYNIAPYVMGAVNRLGIPGIRFVGWSPWVLSGHGTAVPVSMARGATAEPEALRGNASAKPSEGGARARRQPFRWRMHRSSAASRLGPHSGELFRPTGAAGIAGCGADARRTPACHGLRQAFCLQFHGKRAFQGRREG